MAANFSSLRVSREMFTEVRPSATREGSWFLSTSPADVTGGQGREEEEEGG